MICHCTDADDTYIVSGTDSERLETVTVIWSGRTLMILPAWGGSDARTGILGLHGGVESCRRWVNLADRIEKRLELLLRKRVQENVRETCTEFHIISNRISLDLLLLSCITMILYRRGTKTDVEQMLRSLISCPGK